MTARLMTAGPMTVVTRALTLVATVVAATSLAGCTLDESEAAPADPCTAAMEAAADATEIDETISLLDKALVVCRSVEAFDVQVSRYPNMLGFDTVTFLENRCTTADDEAIERSTICASVVTTTTSTLPEQPDLVYVGTTLDGRQIEIRPSEQDPFAEGLPAAIVQIVDVSVEDGCEGVERQFERWRQLVFDPEIGDEASVYAQHALNVSAFIGCDR